MICFCFVQIAKWIHPAHEFNSPGAEWHVADQPSIGSGQSDVSDFPWAKRKFIKAATRLFGPVEEIGAAGFGGQWDRHAGEWKKDFGTDMRAKSG